MKILEVHILGPYCLYIAGLETNVFKKDDATFHSQVLLKVVLEEPLGDL